MNNWTPDPARPDLQLPATRSWAEHVGGTKIRFHHPCGHTSTRDMAAKSRKVSHRIGEMGVRFMANYWGLKPGGSGVTAPCPRCKEKP